MDLNVDTRCTMTARDEFIKGSNRTGLAQPILGVDLNLT